MTDETAAVRMIGRYQVLAEIGRGGMGVVYKGFDPVIGRTVALKTIAFGAADADARQLRERLYREACAAGTLAHPNIVTIYDVLEEGGTTAVAMEFIEGETLASIIAARAPLSLDEAIDIFDQIGAALDYAGARGIVHRDVKPANILITPEGRAKVADFGIARMAVSTVTQTGTILGSPSYMSPEQVKGLPLDRRSDLFSAAIVLYEMVTKDRPFGGTDMATTMYRIVHEPPTPATHFNSAIRPGVLAVFERALSKDPEKRFQSATELTGALRQATGSGAVGADRGVSGAATTRRAYLILSGAALVVLVLALWFIFGGALRTAFSPATGGAPESAASQTAGEPAASTAASPGTPPESMDPTPTGGGRAAGPESSTMRGAAPAGSQRPGTSRGGAEARSESAPSAPPSAESAVRTPSPTPAISVSAGPLQTPSAQSAGQPAVPAPTAPVVAAVPTATAERQPVSMPPPTPAPTAPVVATPAPAAPERQALSTPPPTPVPTAAPAPPPRAPAAAEATLRLQYEGAPYPVTVYSGSSQLGRIENAAGRLSVAPGAIQIRVVSDALFLDQVLGTFSVQPGEQRTLTLPGTASAVIGVRDQDYAGLRIFLNGRPLPGPYPAQLTRVVAGTHNLAFRWSTGKLAGKEISQPVVLGAGGHFLIRAVPEEGQIVVQQTR